MGLKKIIKIKLGKITILKSIRYIVRKKAFYNFETAKLIAIIFDATQTEDYTTARFFCNYFSGKKTKCRCLGYLKPQDIVEAPVGFSDFTFFSEKDFNIFGKPNSHLLIDFCKTEFDILIDLRVKENYFLEAITAFSVAKMKIGLKNNDKGFYDFMIDISDPITTEQMVEQLKIYLNNIKA